MTPAFKLAVLNGTVKNEIIINIFESDGTVKTVITNKYIVAGSLKLTQGICDEPQLRFGGCVASSFEIDISSQFDDLTDKYITVYCRQTATMPLYPSTLVYPDAHIFPGGISYTEDIPLFSGDVYSCALAKNRLTRRLVAYDRFYTWGMRSCKSVYDGLFIGGGTVTLGALRAAIISAFGFTEAQAVTLPADSFVIHKMDCDELYVNDALRMIGELNGVFLWLNGHGDIEYISIGTSGSSAVEVYDHYIDADADEQPVTGFDCIDTHSIGVYNMPGTDEQEAPYDLDNALVTAGYGAADSDLPKFQTAWNGIRAAVEPNFTVAYTPFELTATARLWVQLGDRVRFIIKWYSLQETAQGEQTVQHTTTVESVILSRRLTGIEAMRDEQACACRQYAH